MPAAGSAGWRAWLKPFGALSKWVGARPERAILVLCALVITTLASAEFYLHEKRANDQEKREVAQEQRAAGQAKEKEYQEVAAEFIAEDEAESEKAAKVAAHEEEKRWDEQRRKSGPKRQAASGELYY